MYRFAKFTGLIIIAVLMVGITIGCGSSRKNIEDLAAGGNEIRIYEVFGMDCPGCHGGVENLINRLDGVIGSRANWKKQELTVVISAQSDITDQIIFDTIKQSNFTPGKRIK